MAKRFLIVFLFLYCSILSLKCKKTQICNDILITPPFIFQIKSNGQSLPDSILSNIKLVYYNQNNKDYVSDLRYIAIDTLSNLKGLITTQTIEELSANNNIKTYYIQYPNDLNTDTLYVNYIKGKCSGFYPQQIKLNNQIISIDTSSHIILYVLNKQ